MKKIAVISDVHGNLEALKTILLDIKKEALNKYTVWEIRLERELDQMNV